MSPKLVFLAETAAAFDGTARRAVGVVRKAYEAGANACRVADSIEVARGMIRASGLPFRSVVLVDLNASARRAGL